MDGLELIKTVWGTYYWRLDYRFADDLDGLYIESMSYRTDREAVNALISNNIVWESAIPKD